MSRWIRKTPLTSQQAIPVRVITESDASAHECVPPDHVDAGPRSVWECDCGTRWRIATPYWRPLRGRRQQLVTEVPAWVRDMVDQPPRQP